jgi:hypothetical protein
MQLSEALGIAALVAVTLAGFAGVVVVLLQLYNIVVPDWVLAVLRRDRRPADGGDLTVRPARSSAATVRLTASDCPILMWS